MLAGINEVLLISTPEDIGLYERLLGDGSQWGMCIQYKIQPSPDGLAQAFILGEEFIGTDSVCLVLGDNIFYGYQFSEMLNKSRAEVEDHGYAKIFGYSVSDPERYGVAEFDGSGNVLSIEEKPKKPKSNYAVVGLYFYPNSVIDIAKNVKPSARGELEITSVNNTYLTNNNLKISKMGRGLAWLDTGTYHSMLEASNYIETIQNRQGLMVACPEEIAWRNGWITNNELTVLASELKKNKYGQSLLSLLN